MSSEHVSSLAEQFGASEALIQRSADARAAASGTSADAILAAWTGGTPAPPPAAPVAEQPPAPAPPPEAVADDDQTPEPPATPEPVVETEAEPEPAGEPVLAVQKAGRSFSPWMVAAFFVIPLFGLLYLINNSNGVACGDGGSLEVAFDGSLVNCDGTAFEGRGGGGAEAAAFLALGQEIYGAGAQCASCHGANGQGGTGPAMAGGAVLVTWPSCDEQVQWIALGSDGWSVAVGSTYGADDKPVQGGMPGFEADLTDEEIRAVSAFERIRFGGAPAEETLIACGLLEEEPVEGEPAEGEPVEGEPATEG